MGITDRVSEFAKERFAIAKDTAGILASRVTTGGPILSEAAIGPFPAPVPVGAVWGQIRARRIANRRKLFGF